MPKISEQARFYAPCEICHKTKEGDYVKYSFLGFELLFMMCKDCFLHIRIAGLTHLHADLEAFREQLGEANEDPADD